MQKKKIIFTTLSMLLLSQSLHACGCHDAGSEKAAVNAVKDTMTSTDESMAEKAKEMWKEIQTASNTELEVNKKILSIDYIKKLNALEVEKTIHQVERMM